MVGPNDRIYHLGDFSFLKRADTEAILKQLHGRKYFVRGNHDKTMDRLKGHFESYDPYKEIKVPIDGETKRIVLCHFPVLSFHQVAHGAWHLHGHCHGNLQEDDVARMDVGVDTHDYRPWNMDEIAEHLKGKHGLPGDHHGLGQPAGSPD